MSEARIHKVKDIFVEGPIDPAFIATSIAKHATRTEIGAHEIFWGQVRADQPPTLNLQPFRRSNSPPTATCPSSA